MGIASKSKYLSETVELLKKHWPDNKTVNIVCHGHSVPAGYFATPLVDTFNAYPHLLHRGLKHRYPYAVINVIVTAIGGETSERGSERFTEDVLCHKPDVITIDYAINDQGLGLEKSYECWSKMIRKGLEYGAKIILLSPTPTNKMSAEYEGDDKYVLAKHAEQIRELATKYEIGLADSYAACEDYCSKEDINDILSWSNHPNRNGHEIVTRQLLRWFAAC